MPECGNCGGHVTPNYARVFTPSDHEKPRTCPNCELTREADNTVRESRT